MNQEHKRRLNLLDYLDNKPYPLREFGSHFRLGDGVISAYIGITTTDVVAGLSYCSPNDQFNKRLGLERAEGYMWYKSDEPGALRYLTFPLGSEHSSNRIRAKVWETVLTEIDNNPHKFPTWVRRGFTDLTVDPLVKLFRIIKRSGYQFEGLRNENRQTIRGVSLEYAESRTGY